MLLARCITMLKISLQSAIPRFLRHDYNLSRNMVNSNPRDHIVWIDMEMTGIDIDKCHILEIACVITNKNLEIISEDLNIVIHQPDEILETMNDWCKTHHNKSGLINEVRSSKCTLADAEEIVLKHLQQHVPEGLCPIAGNSVYMDRMFLQKYMPSINNFLHYKIIDASTLKELVKWDIKIPQFTKGHAHRALPDIKDSIKELEHYKKYIF